MKKLIFATVFTVAHLFALENMDTLLEECLVKSKNGSCQQIADYFKSGCDNGTKSKCFLYADMIGRGIGVQRDLALSYEIFKKGCENNVSEACYEQSVKDLEGLGAVQSFENSTKALVKACDLGSARACEILTFVPQI